MWLITTVGFFSVVQKPEDVDTKTLTVRARVREDLEALKTQCLPELGAIQESASNDYRFRARAPQAAVARAMAAIVEGVNYANFKDEVALRQGPTRAALYHDVWSVLLRLQAGSPRQRGTSKPPSIPRQVLTGPALHPQRNDQGKRVTIQDPSTPTPLASWLAPGERAVAVPAGEVPGVLNGVPLTPWDGPPNDAPGWERLAAESRVAEPTFDVPPGLAPAAGVVVTEPDGRLWLVVPTNRFGGYDLTFAKGRIEGKSLRATAICEAYEEAGLRVRLVRHLVDVRRSQTFTRYYLAERIGGTPSDMGWESQAVVLLPLARLMEENLAEPDRLVVQALMAAQG